jgi:hypothetical protein
MIFFGILLLQGIMQKPKMGNYFSHSRLMAMPHFSRDNGRKEILPSQAYAFCQHQEL